MELGPEATPLHTYSGLEGPRHIRILVLDPSLDPSLPLQFSFSQASLVECQGKYEAVSYTWGEPKLTEPLHCSDGSHVLVTKNLDLVLRRLRNKVEKRHLWADAACINQADNQEKAIQIPLMVDIFRGAAGVLAWVGPGGDAEQGLGTLDHLSRQYYITREDPIELEQRKIDNIVRLFESAYFNRMWIIQEIIFNVDVTLICGSTILSWVRFCAGMNILERLANVGSSSPYIRRKIKDIANMFGIWKSHSMIELDGKPATISAKQGPDMTMLRLLEYFSHYNVTDNRDRIFALYSMAIDIKSTSSNETNDRRIFMPIDYTKNESETFEAFAMACLKAGQGSALLGTVMRRPTSLRSVHLPSWVPNLSVPLDRSIKISRLRDIDYLGSQGKCVRLRMPVYSLDQHATSNFQACDPSVTIDALGPRLENDSNECLERFFDSILEFLPEFYVTTRRPETSQQGQVLLEEDWLYVFDQIIGPLYASSAAKFHNWLVMRMYEARQRHAALLGSSSQANHTLNEAPREWNGMSSGQVSKKLFLAMNGERLFRAVDTDGSAFYGSTNSPIQPGDVLLHYNGFSSLVMRPTTIFHPTDANASCRIRGYKSHVLGIGLGKRIDLASASKSSFRIIGQAKLSDKKFPASSDAEDLDYIDMPDIVDAEFWLG